VGMEKIPGVTGAKRRGLIHREVDASGLTVRSVHAEAAGRAPDASGSPLRTFKRRQAPLPARPGYAEGARGEEQCL